MHFHRANSMIKSKKYGTHSLDSKPHYEFKSCHHMISDMNPTSEVKAVSGNVLIENGDRIL